MKPAESRKCDDVPSVRSLHFASGRSIAAERHVGPVDIVVFCILANAPSEMALAKNDHVVGEPAPERSDKPLGEAVLPRRPRCNPQLPNAEVVHSSIECPPEDPVAIPDEEFERAVLPETLDDLLGRPRAMRMRRHIRVKNQASLERQNDEDVQHVECHRRDREKIDGKSLPK